MYLGCICDDILDTLPATVVHECMEIGMDVLRNPNKPRPDGESPFGKTIKEFVPIYTTYDPDYFYSPWRLFIGVGSWTGFRE